MKLFEQGTFVTPYGLSAEEIVARRKRLDENKPDFGNARYIGEGIGDAVAGFLWGKNARRLDKMEGDERKRLKDLIASAFGGSSLTGGSYSGAGYSGGGYSGGSSQPTPPKPVEARGTTPGTDVAGTTAGMTINGFSDGGPKVTGTAIAPAPINWANIPDNLRPNEDLTGAVAQSVAAKLGPDWQIVPTSGHRPGDPRYHGQGRAMDFAIENSKTGERLSWDDPRLKTVAADSSARGVRGFGAGPNYMGGNVFHFDNRPGDIGVWSDDNGTTSQGGPGAAMWRPDLVAAMGQQPDPVTGFTINGFQQPTPGSVRTASNERLSTSNNPLVNTAAQIAREEGVPEDLFLGLVQQESSWNPDAVSSAGAIGLAQLMPGTARDLGVDPNDLEQNLRGGARYLKAQLDRFGSPELALAAYNAGPERVARAGGIPNIDETQNYVSRITGNLGNAPQVAPTDGGQRVAQGYGGQGNAALWAEILSNPFTDSGQRAVAQMMLQQSMTQGQPQKGVVVNGRLVNPFTGEVIGDYSGGAVGGGTEYGLTPQLIQMEDGSLGFMQLGKDGTSKLVELPEGASIAKGYEKVDLGTHFQWFDPLGKPFGEPVAKDVRGEASESAAGAAEGKAGADAAINAPKIRADSEQTLTLINQLLDPKNQGALEGILGKYEGNLDPGTLKGALFLSQEETDLIPLVEQLQGKTFLQAYAQLRGAQAITDIEGQKATQAIARLQRTQGPEAFRAALIELMGIIETGMRRLESGQTVGAPTDAYGMSDDEFLKSLGLE